MVRLMEMGAECIWRKWDIQDNNTAYNTYNAFTSPPNNEHFHRHSSVHLGWNYQAYTTMLQVTPYQPNAFSEMYHAMYKEEKNPRRHPF